MTELHGVEEHAEDSADRCVHVHKVGSRSGQRCNTPATGDGELCREHRALGSNGHLIGETDPS